MPERDPFFAATEQLISVLSDAEKLGNRAKSILIDLLAKDLPELPKIKSYDETDSLYRWKYLSALPIELGGLNKEVDRLTTKIPERTPLIAMTNEGIFRVPLANGFNSTNVMVYVADWDRREELQPLEYLNIVTQAVNAIRLEKESQVRSATATPA